MKMTVARTRRGLRGLLVAVTAIGLIAVPTAGAELATSSDAAGDAYKAAIAKAKGKRTSKLQACAKKSGKAKRACRKAANKSFTVAKEKAKEEREKARYAAKTPQEKAEQRHDEMREYRDCIREHRSPRECR